MEFGIDSNPQRRMTVAATDLKPGDILVDTGCMVIEPGAFVRGSTPPGRIEVAVRDDATGATWVTIPDQHYLYTILRRNLVIPGLER